MRRWVCGAILGLVAVWIASAGPARADYEAASLRALLAKCAPSIVTVRAGIKSAFTGGGESAAQESRLSLQGAIVTPDGLVMITNAPFAPKRMMQMLGMGGMDDAMGMKSTPTSFRITLADDTKEYDGFLVATDTNLDLMFVKIDGLAGKTLPAVDFGHATDPAVGDRAYVVSRLPKGYDYAPAFQSARISGEVAKPRKAWTLDGAAQFGLPAFDGTGNVLGVITTVPSGVSEDTSEEMSFAMFMRFFGGGSSTGSVFLVPASALKAVVDQAVAKVPQVEAERAKKKSEAPAPAPSSTPKPKAPAPAKPAH